MTYFIYKFGILIVGATFTEKIFGWHGMGEWFVDSVTRQDINAVAAVTLLRRHHDPAGGAASRTSRTPLLDPRIRVS